MVITNVLLEDIGPFERIETKPGMLTTLLAGNGMGKSKYLEALQTSFDGGYHPEMIRHGCKKGTITITLNTGVVIKNVITLKGYTLTVTSPDGEEIKAPATFVKELASGFALDPIAFIDAGKKGSAGVKERLKFLRQILGSNYTSAELVSAIGEASVCLTGTDNTNTVSFADMDADQFDILFKTLYDKRTRANTEVEDLQGTVTTLTRTLPSEPEGTDWQEEVKRLRAEKKALDEEKLSEITKIEVEQHDLLTSIALSLNQDIEALRKKFEEICEEARSEASKKSDEVRSKATATRQELDAAADPVIQAKVAELTTAEDRLKNAVTIRTTKENIETIRNKSREAGIRALKLDQAVKNLEELKRSKLASMPVEGLEMKDGKLYVDGLDFDTQINTARQYAIAFQLCAHGAGSLQLMVCDRAESLAAESTWKEFQEAAKASGYQVFVARVDDGPLKITAN